MSTNAALGHLAKNWPSLNASAPAIIVNPAASPLDVLAWCWGEVESLRAIVDVIGESGAGVDGNAVADVLLHRLAPLSAVRHDAIQALVVSQRQDGRGTGGEA